jgi:hypothetical protein
MNVNSITCQRCLRTENVHYNSYGVVIKLGEYYGEMLCEDCQDDVFNERQSNKSWRWTVYFRLLDQGYGHDEIITKLNTMQEDVDLNTN